MLVCTEYVLVVVTYCTEYYYSYSVPVLFAAGARNPGGAEIADFSARSPCLLVGSFVTATRET